MNPNIHFFSKPACIIENMSYFGQKFLALLSLEYNFGAIIFSKIVFRRRFEALFIPIYLFIIQTSNVKTSSAVDWQQYPLCK